jgi:hypothetical protein
LSSKKGNQAIKFHYLLSCIDDIMAHAKSQTQVIQLAREAKDTLMACAVTLYLHEQDKDLAPGQKKMSLRAVCKQIEGEYEVEKGKRVSLSHHMLLHLANGGQSKSLSNEEKGWLLSDKVEVVIGYTIELANRGFPQNQR